MNNPGINNSTHKRRRLLWLILPFALLLYGIISWYMSRKNDPYPTFIKPRLELGIFKIKKFTPATTYMDMQMLIDNPLPAGMKLDSMTFKMLIGGVEVAKSEYPAPMDIDANDSSMVSLPLEIRNRELLGILKKLERLGQDSTEYRIVGTCHVSLPGLKNKPIDFDIKHNWPTLYIPKVELKDIKVKKTGLKHTYIVFTVDIENPSAFAYAFRETYYKVGINNDHLVAGTIDSVIHIPAHGKATVNLPADVSLVKGFETLWDSWLKSASTTYNYYFECKIVSDDNMLRDSKIIMEADGKLKDLKP